MALYGSTHTHFDSYGDTANKLPVMIDEFIKAGAKRVAVTEHGDMTSFEELKDICEKKVDEDKKRLLDVIPGVEGYFNTSKDDSEIEKGTEDRDHFILIAKDEIGYHYLSHIVTDSNIDHDSKNRPCITWENLKKNVKEPGHIFCTTACIAGPFGKIFRDDKAERARQIKRYRDRIPYTDEEVSSIVEQQEVYQGLKASERDKLSDEDKAFFKKNSKKFNAIRRSLAKIDELNEAPLSFTEEGDTEDDILEKKNNAAFQIYDRLCMIFGTDMVYLEIQNHGLLEEAEVYPAIMNFASLAGAEDHLIAANDIHVGKTSPTEDDFLRRNVAQANRWFTDYKTFLNRPVDDTDRQLYIKSDEALKEALMALPYEGSNKEALIDTAIGNIEHVLSSCDVEYIYAKGKDHYPKFTEDENALFDELIEKGKAVKFPNGFPDDRYEKRLSHEKEVIKSMGYAGYHLIVQDYLDYGRNLGYLPKEEVADAPLDLDELKEKVKGLPHEAISIGPGRGSGVGSLCCYLLGITDIDPLKYDLLFERFLNPERVSMPDIDADFRTDIRQKCIDHCAYKYGKDNVCKIMTKSYSDLKGNLRIAARYLGAIAYENEFPKEQRILLGTDHEKDYIQKNYIKKAEALAKKVENIDKKDVIPDDIANGLRDIDEKIYRLALKIDGLHTAFGEHAAGNIISKDIVSDVIPLRWNKESKDYSTQCTMGDAEARGLLKMDFLGLDNLDILTELMQKTHDTVINDYEKRDALLSDRHVMAHIFDTGLTQGVFQFESDGMKKMLKDFHPDTFEDLILLVAAYRPGPLQYLPEIIARKQHQDDPVHHPDEPKKTIDIDNPVLNEILAPTYGCMIYQEQVMRVCTDLSGYSLGQADIVRKAMSKKHLDDIEKERTAFIYGDPERNIEGCMKKSGLTEEEGNKLFDQMCAFASYAFNKSHATAYALISFFTAYYKDRYPALFYAISLNHMKKIGELPPFRAEMNSFGLSLMPPTEGHSKAAFSAEGDKVYFGYGSVKGLPTDLDISGIKNDSVDALIYENPDVSTKVLSSLIKTGMFDSLGNRSALNGYIDTYREKLIKRQETKEAIGELKEEMSPVFIRLNECLSSHPEFYVKRGEERSLSDEEALQKLLKTKDACLLSDYPIAEYKEMSVKLKRLMKTYDPLSDIPDFREYEKENALDPDREAECALLGTVFFNSGIENLLSQYPAFSDLPEGRYQKKECAFYCLSTDKKAYHSKFDNSVYYAADFMDKNYCIKRYFVTFPVEPGLYKGAFSQYPFSTIQRDAGENGQIKSIFTPLRPEEEYKACIKVTNNLKRRASITRLFKIQQEDGERRRYCPIYTGTSLKSQTYAGSLDKEEFERYVRSEAEEHDTEFLYGDEYI